MAQASGAGNWKPVELDREQDDQHGAQPKAGERHPGDRERHRRVIYRGALACRGSDVRSSPVTSALEKLQSCPYQGWSSPTACLSAWRSTAAACSPSMMSTGSPGTRLRKSEISSSAPNIASATAAPFLTGSPRAPRRGVSRSPALRAESREAWRRPPPPYLRATAEGKAGRGPGFLEPSDRAPASARGPRPPPAPAMRRAVR